MCIIVTQRLLEQLCRYAIREILCARLKALLKSHDGPKRFFQMQLSFSKELEWNTRVCVIEIVSNVVIYLTSVIKKLFRL